MKPTNGLCRVMTKAYMDEQGMRGAGSAPFACLLQTMGDVVWVRVPSLPSLRLFVDATKPESLEICTGQGDDDAMRLALTHLAMTCGPSEAVH